MAIYRSLKSLTKNLSKTRGFLTATYIIPTPYTPLLHPYLSHRFSPSYSSPFISPLSKWIFPFQGPLFLSSPPWKLLQSSTPLYLRGNSVVLRKVEALSLNLHLIRDRTRFPGKLGFGSVLSEPRLLNGVDSKEAAGRESFLESFLNLPNLISMGRLVSGPLLGWMITNEMYSYAFLGLAISGATDWLDGYLARKLRISSVIGSYLDPLADKVLIGSVALAMVHMDLLHPGLVGIVVLRDVALVGGALYQRASNMGWQWKSWFDFFNLDGTSPHKVEPLFISKVNTVFQLVLAAGALLQPEFGTQETQLYITYLSWLVASTTIASTAAYGAQHMKKLASITRKP